MDNKPVEEKKQKKYNLFKLFWLAINAIGMEFFVFTIILYPDINIFTWTTMLVVLFSILISDLVYVGIAEIKKLLLDYIG